MRTIAFDEENEEYSFTEEIIFENIDEKPIIPQRQHRNTFTTDGPFIETKEYLG